MRRTTGKPGFVLVMVLAVLAIAGTALAITARRCAERALAAGARQRRLQLKWGSLSCQAFALPAAERLLAEEAAARQRPAAATRRRVQLGGMGFVMVLSDEQAMLNVNLLAQRLGKAGFASRIHQVQSRQALALPVRLRPVEPRTSAISTLPPLYVSLDQVWAFDHPSQMIRADGASAREGVTCWSSGKVNFKRAAPAVLREATAGILTELQLAKLLQFVRSEPDCTLLEAIGHLELPEGAAARAQSVLTDQSNCHALWVIAQGRTRRWYRLFVRRVGDAENDAMGWAFRW